MKSNYYKLNITALIYPNDDYVGGEIGWPDYDLEIKPESGDMVMFPANNDYLHYVKEVVSGIRYTMPMWYTFDTQAPDIKMNYNPNDSKNLWVNEGEDTSNLRSY
jgi:predicted 2-oxoglutarate/Fe(II)-dependent dioxygenase YbiX